MKDFSIGMFDSGIGGLTVLKEVRRFLPHEHIIYLGDTARVPYGNRSPQTVTRYSLENTGFLLSKGIKMLIIACNTSSAIALPALKRKVPVPVIGVIEPPAREAARRTKTRRIGVIGTRATINSRAYVKAIRRHDPAIEVISVACPLFVPIVEEGLENDEVARVVVRKYLEVLKDSGIDVLVMGCTHYPILEHQIRELLGDEVHIVNTGRETARDVERVLAKHDSARERGKGGCEYFVTDAPDKLSDLGGRVLGEPLKRVRLVKDLDAALPRASA
ncbi:MAG: Glutamate racemase [Syntrophorhabdaceae bacterium PtaU1.Bin034]|nr:MAG: Glutamate racemase [Syntrophorhabdaceae bacterium PtaU1.Bin034]